MNVIGVVEFHSIPTGIWNLDKVLKIADLNVYRAGVTCPGKYFFIIYGDNQAVEIGMKDIEGAKKIEIISGVSDDILEVLLGKRKEVKGESIGVFEFTNIPESVKSLDHVLKSTQVTVLKLVLGYGTAGKSYYVITGDTSSIDEAVVLVTGSYELRDHKVINNPTDIVFKYI